MAPRRPLTDARAPLLDAEPVAVAALLTAWRGIALGLGIREAPDPDVIAAIAFAQTAHGGPWTLMEALRILDALEADARARRLQWGIARTAGGAPVLAHDPLGRVDNLAECVAELRAIGRDRADAELAATVATWTAQGFDQTTIARRLGVTDRSVRRLLARARPRLVRRAA